MLFEKFPTEDDRILAGEHALGLLSEIEAVKFERRLEAEPILQGIYNAWLLEFPPLDEADSPKIAPAGPDNNAPDAPEMAATVQAPIEQGRALPKRAAQLWSGIQGLWPRGLALAKASAAPAQIDSDVAFFKARRALKRRENLGEVLRQTIIAVELAAVLAVVVAVGVLALTDPSEVIPPAGVPIIGP